MIGACLIHFTVYYPSHGDNSLSVPTLSEQNLAFPHHSKAWHLATLLRIAADWRGYLLGRNAVWSDRCSLCSYLLADAFFFVLTVRFWTKSRDFSLVHSVQTASGTHPTYCPKVTRASSQGWSGRDVKLTAYLLLVQGSRLMKPFHIFLRLRGLVLNYTSTGRTYPSTLSLKVVCSSEKSVKFGFTIWRYIPEYIIFRSCSYERKSSKVCLGLTV